MHHKRLMMRAKSTEIQSSFRRGAETSTRGACAPQSIALPPQHRDVITPYPDKAFAAFGDEAVEHRIVESTDVEFRSERLLRFFVRTHDRAPPYNLSKNGWSLGWISAVDSEGRTTWIV
jgi:hypothetical protein